jgi:4-hydroxybenzoate polyprenyltransferase
MARPESGLSLRTAVFGTVAGRRGFVKSAHLWLPLSLMLSTAPVHSLRGAWRECLLLFAMVTCWAQAAILVNDVVDARQDTAAGKVRWIARLPAWLGGGIVAVLVAGGAAAGWAGAAAPRPLVAYGMAVLLALAYSLPPFRLKDRARAGVLTYSLSAGCAFALVPLSWFHAPWHAAVALLPAVVLDKWVNLHFHQVVDHDADSATGARTYAVTVGRAAARATLAVAAWLAASWLAGSIVYAIAVLPAWRPAAGTLSAAGALAAGLYAARSRGVGRQETSLVSELPAIYLGLTWAAFRVLPAILLARLVLLAPGMAVPLALFVALLALEAWYCFRYQYR